MRPAAGDQRTRFTKQLIRQAFIHLLQQKPLRSITVKELCALAGINRGTFYSHYLDLYDLLEKIEEEMLRDFQKALEPLLSSQAGELDPVHITAGIYQCLKDNADICTVTLGEFGDKGFALRLVNLGRERCMESYSKYFKNASPWQIQQFYAFVSAGHIGLLQQWLADGMTASAGEMAAIAESIMTLGIGFLQNPGASTTL